MRVRLITRDVAYFPQRDWEKINHQTDLIVLWGNQPVPRGFVTIQEFGPDWKPKEWASTPSSISIPEPATPTPAPLTQLEAPPWLRRIDVEQDPPSPQPGRVPVAAAPEPAKVKRLAPREIQIYRLHAKGMNYETIAQELGLKTESVKKMANNARAKVRAGAIVPPEAPDVEARTVSA